MKKDVKNLVWQFFKFGIVGFANTAISTAITYGLLRIFCRLVFFNSNLEIQMLVSSFLGFSCSFFNSYYWNSKFVFRKNNAGFFSKSFFKSYFCYFTTWLISYIIATLVVTSLVLKRFFISEFWVPMFTIVITVPLNFLVNKFWAFR